MCTDVVILAGGSGERLWPVSDAQRPKQFMALSNGESFLQSAILRAAALNLEGDICVVTRKDWTDLVVSDVLTLAAREGMADLPSKVLIMSEPCGKNTAPAIVWTSKYLMRARRSKPASVLLMASDHIIKPLDAFVEDVEAASYFADQGNLVTFAIPPTYPATGYGYIKVGRALHCPIVESPSAFKIEYFREKPNEATAREYVDDGHYYWNSGLYAFRADFYLSEIERHSPDVAKAFSALGASCEIETREGIRVMTRYEGLDEAYARSPSISIDYAISEKCETAVTVRASFLWDDVGTWDSLAKYYGGLPKDAFAVDSSDCFVHSDIPVALCGVDGLVIVIRNGKALVARKGETNLVKDALSLMKKAGLE